MNWLRASTLLLAGAVGAPAAELYNYWIEPCAGETASQSGCDAADPELARWALAAWQQAAGPGLRFEVAKDQGDARIHFYWVGKKAQLYGDMHIIYLNGRKVYVIDVQPDLAQFGPRIAAAGRDDRLFRDTVVYLTCLHETGHVLAIPHTDDFGDIMYSFQYGGDVLEYFSRYRRMLHERSDIRAHAGIPETDRKRVASQYAGP
ncbi:MAG TPA: hypothetical protein VKR61_17995 [Bryobacteraceae bacterium]|nr:hypothetical protein [Bryobacteraceae bacterium]